MALRGGIEDRRGPTWELIDATVASKGGLMAGNNYVKTQTLRPEVGIRERWRRKGDLKGIVQQSSRLWPLLDLGGNLHQGNMLDDSHRDGWRVGHRCFLVCRCAINISLVSVVGDVIRCALWHPLS